ncbi:MAG: hypothetical protein Dasosvirus9_1, partial [Dasosvirus sp.]
METCPNVDILPSGICNIYDPVNLTHLNIAFGDNTKDIGLTIIILNGTESTNMYIANRITRWINWNGVRAKFFDTKCLDTLYETIYDWVKKDSGKVAIISVLTDCHKINEKFGNIKILHIGDFMGQMQREDTDHLSYIKLLKPEIIQVRNISNHLQYTISNLLVNINTLRERPPKIYITRHGQSEGQIKEIIGGNSELTLEGIKYSDRLKKFMDKVFSDHKQVNVMCSSLKRSIQTASVFINDSKYHVTQWKSLDEIYGGMFEDVDYGTIKEKYPEIYEKRMNDKYNMSWPGGESYHNLIQRLKSLFLKLENTTIPVIIVAHQAVCRGLYAYL